MKKFLLIVFFSSSVILLFAQEVFKKNAVFFELLGNGLLTSINYERQLVSLPGFGFRVGVGLYSFTGAQITVPFGINYLFKLKNSRSFIDAGFGITYVKADVTLYSIVDYRDPNYVNTHYINYIPSLAFRKHTLNDVMWRFSLTPVFNQHGGLPYVGVSIGKMFK